MGELTSSWIGFALATAPSIAIYGFVLGSLAFLGCALALWFEGDAQIRSSPLSNYFKLSLVFGTVFGGASFVFAAIYGWPALFALNVLSYRLPAWGEWMREWIFGGRSAEDWALSNFQFTFRMGGLALGTALLLMVAYAVMRKWEVTQAGR